MQTFPSKGSNQVATFATINMPFRIKIKILIMNYPYRKGVVTAQTIAHLMMITYLLPHAVDLTTTLSCYGLFACSQYLIVLTYRENVWLTSCLDAILSLVSLIVPYTVREIVGHKFVVSATALTTDTLSQFPLVTGDNLWAWGLCFYFLTRFVGLGYGLCFSRMGRKAESN